MIDFDTAITGLGATPNGLLVFTHFKTYIVTGTSPGTLSKYLLNGSQGCIAHNSIRFVDNTLLWLSNDGACASSGGTFKVLSRDKLSKAFMKSLGLFRDSAVHDDVYYLGCDNGIVCLDFRFGLVFRLIDTVIDSFHLYDDILYYSKGGQLFSLGTGSSESREMSYRSPKLSEGQVSNLKNYKSVYVKCNGQLNLSIYVDGAVAMVKLIDEKTSEVLIPQPKRKGYYIEFGVIGDGELLELQYIVEARQNGR